MKKVRLELDSLEILVKRNKWNLYFIVYTNHPSEPTKSLIRLLPDTGTILLTNKSENPYSFKPVQEGGDGLKIFQGDLPEDESIDIRLCMMQSRTKLRNTAEIVADVTGELSAKGLKEIISLSNVQWFVIDAGLDVITNILSKVKDRNMGFVSMDEEFEEEFNIKPSWQRTRKLSSGKAQLTWVWKLKE
jgi:hypothetical protein